MPRFWPLSLQATEALGETLNPPGRDTRRTSVMHSCTPLTNVGF